MVKARPVRRDAQDSDDIRSEPGDLRLERAASGPELVRGQLRRRGGRPVDQVRDAEAYGRQILIVERRPLALGEARAVERLPEAVARPGEVVPDRPRVQPRIDAHEHHVELISEHVGDRAAASGVELLSGRSPRRLAHFESLSDGWRSRPVSRILCAALTRRRRPSLSVGRSRVRRVAVRPRRAATRELGRAALERSLLALLRTGVAEPRRSPAALVGSYPTVSPLPLRRSAEAVCFLLPLREVAPAWLSPASCPAESGLSSPRAHRTGARPPGRLLRPRRYRVRDPPRPATRRPLRWRAGPPRRSARAGRART